MDKKELNVLMIGPDIHAQGGISAVIQKYYAGGISDMVDLKYLCTTRDTNRITKLYCALVAYIKVLFMAPWCDIAHVHVASRNSYKRKSIILKYLYFLKKKVIIHLHGGEFDKFFLYECNDQAQRNIRDIFNKANMIIVLSLEWKEKIIGIIGTSVADRTVILHNAVDIPAYIPKDYSLRNMIFLGRLVDGKGIKDLLSSMATVKERFPTSQLTICGGGNTEAYIKKADELNISDCVSFPGWISGAEKENLLRNATVFILPSYNEGLPVSMLEAMSYGLACVVTDVGGIPSVINNGENGLLIEPGNIEMLTNTICMLLDDQQRIKENT